MVLYCRDPDKDGVYILVGEGTVEIYVKYYKEKSMTPGFDHYNKITGIKPHIIRDKGEGNVYLRATAPIKDRDGVGILRGEIIQVDFGSGHGLYGRASAPGSFATRRVSISADDFHLLEFVEL